MGISRGRANRMRVKPHVEDDIQETERRDPPFAPKVFYIGVSKKPVIHDAELTPGNKTGLDPVSYRDHNRAYPQVNEASLPGGLVTEDLVAVVASLSVLLLGYWMTTYGRQ